MRPSIGECLGTVQLDGSSADVWFVTVGPAAMTDLDILSDEERHKARTYRSEEAALRYVLTRSLVRSVLAEHLRIEPRSVPVSRTDAGKPIVAAGLHFNVSHSGALILLAVSRERDVGIDVERRRHVPKVAQLSERWLTPVEGAHFATLTDAGMSPSDAFLRIWSLKEARLKALGVGISGAASADLGSVIVRPLDDLLDLPALQESAAGYVGALAFAAA